MFKKFPKIFTASCYALLSLGLFIIWQNLVIPSLPAIAAVLLLLAWTKNALMGIEIKEGKSNSSRDTKLIWFIASILLAINCLLLPKYQVLIASIGLVLLVLSASELSEKLSRLLVKRLIVLFSLSLPFVLVLFITLPRINLPMQELGLVMGLPISVQADKTLGDKGLGKELSFGDISELGNSNTRVLLANMPSDIELEEGQGLYWRGPVYWRYEDNVWRVREGFDKRSVRQYNGWGSNKGLEKMTNRRENTFSYSVVLYPHGEYWLYGLDLPASLTGESYLSQDYQLLSIRTIDKTWRYKISTSLDYQVSAKEPQAQLDLALVYPNSDPKIKSLARQWRHEFGQDKQAIINRAKQYFSQEKFLYANDDYHYQGNDQLDQFLFERKVGYSQHYASALTLLLRAANIPARLVAGYRGADKLGLTNLYVVNEHHAHVWTEVWLDERWQRIDPSLWLADFFSTDLEQVEAEKAQVQQQENLKQVDLSTTPVAKQVEKAVKQEPSLLDGLSKWTLDFDADKQTTLAKKLGLESLLWWHLLVTALALLLILLVAYWLVLRFVIAGKKPALHIQLYLKYCDKLGKQGLVRLPHEGAQAYFERCALAQPERADHFKQLAEYYLLLCYAPLTIEQQKESLMRFKGLLKKVPRAN